MPNYDLGTKRKKISPYLLIAAIAVLLVLIAYLLGLLSGGGGKISGRKLRCVVSQDVTVFGDRVLYYDDSTLFCLSTAGSELWSVQVGSARASTLAAATLWYGPPTIADSGLQRPLHL